VTRSTEGRASTGDVGIVWFRRDLRLEDNPAWAAATARHDVIVPLHVLDPAVLRWAGPARRERHLAELAALDDELRRIGGRLLLRRGDPVTVVPAEVARLGATAVHLNRGVTPASDRRDAAVAAALPAGAEVLGRWGDLVLAPGSVLTADGSVPKVFTAFWKRWQRARWDEWPEPGDALVTDDAGDGDDLPPATAEAGSTGAHAALTAFLDGPVDDYRAGRDRIDRPATSELSVALHFGTISARRVVEAAGSAGADRQAFIRQLAWRDWYAHLLAAHPQLVDHAMRPELDRIEWRHDPDGFEAWRDGRTGYPIVDAGMRQLAETGRMHNRVRMVVASFLVKDLLIDWRLGERHLRRALIDGDVAQNVGNWQWVAGTGPDAVPYFRVLNPVTQGRRHDPDGTFVRRWVPELRGLPGPDVHAPWELDEATLRAAGVELGRDYPHPIVDHAAARERAIGAYRVARPPAAGDDTRLPAGPARRGS